jgi:lysozyme
MTATQPYNLTIQIPRAKGDLLAWFLTGLLMAPAIAFMAHPGLNAWMDARLHTEGFHLATPGLTVGDKQIIPGKTLYYWQPPLAGQEVPTGGEGGTGLSEEPVKKPMSVAGFPVTSDFGPRQSPGGIGSTNHRGVDLGTPVGTPVKAFVAGTKVTCWWDEGGGGQVASIWIGPEFYHAMHLSSCRNGTYGPGETYARTGNTGTSTGPHLHWENLVGGVRVLPKLGALEASLLGQPPPGFNPAPYVGGPTKDLAGFVGKFEGFRPCPYIDPVGVATIGYGTTFYPGGQPVRMGDACIDEAKAREFKTGDLAKFNNVVKSSVTRPMTPNQEKALTSFIYNVGPAGAKSTAVQRFNQGDTHGAAEALKQWNKGKVNGRMQVLPGLVSRRAEEAELLKR